MRGVAGRPGGRSMLRDMSDQTATPPNLIRATARASIPERSFSHPFNPASELHGVSLGDAVGLQRIGLHLVRVPPGKESFILHAHHTEEEFLYILGGRGVAQIGDAEHEVGPGDFLGFPTPSVAHHLRNPFDEDLVYLSGGERHAVEIADLPGLGKRMIRAGMTVSIHTLDEAESFPSLPLLESL